MTDTFKAGFDLTRLSWLLVSGRAEIRSEGDIVANTGGSVDNLDEDKYELIVKNRLGEFLGFHLERDHIEPAHRRLALETRDQNEGRAEAQVE